MRQPKVARSTEEAEKSDSENKLTFVITLFSFILETKLSIS